MDWLARVAAFGSVFDAPDFEFGRWVPSRKLEDGSWSMPWYDFSRPALEFLGSMPLKPKVNWPEWAASDTGQRLMQPLAVAGVSADELQKLMTALVRGDRFREGTLAHAHETGLLRAIIRRAGELAAADTT